MALNAYLTIKGAVQGQIKGGVTQKGKEGQIAAYAYHHEIISPRDAASGLPSGKRQHKPLTITKEIDKSTPLLLKALVTNESLKEVNIHFFANSATGMEVQNYTVKLINAAIASISQDMALNKIEPGIKLPVLEEISFTYQKIEWTWIDGGITTTDDWHTVT
ncbi:MAG: type VI secretion system tube protein TssD [Ginsengibacter sp.]